MAIPKPHDPNVPSIDPEELAQRVEDVLASDAPVVTTGAQPDDAGGARSKDPLRVELERLQAAHNLLSEALK